MKPMELWRVNDVVMCGDTKWRVCDAIMNDGVLQVRYREVEAMEHKPATQQVHDISALSVLWRDAKQQNNEGPHLKQPAYTCPNEDVRNGVKRCNYYSSSDRCSASGPCEVF